MLDLLEVFVVLHVLRSSKGRRMQVAVARLFVVVRDRIS